MIDLFKKGVFAGVGAAAVTKESAEKVLKDLVERGKISDEEAREYAEKIVNEGEETTGQAQSYLESLFQEFLERSNVASHRQLKALEERVAQLEERVEDESIGTAKKTAAKKAAE